MASETKEGVPTVASVAPAPGAQSAPLVALKSFSADLSVSTNAGYGLKVGYRGGSRHRATPDQALLDCIQQLVGIARNAGLGRLLDIALAGSSASAPDASQASGRTQ